jgi:hypothetical protein
MSITFKLTDEKCKKIKEFHPKCKKKYTGAIGGGEEYTFSPTSLGDIVTYTCKCGAELDLTDYNW